MTSLVRSEWMLISHASGNCVDGREARVSQGNKKGTFGLSSSHSVIVGTGIYTSSRLLSSLEPSAYHLPAQRKKENSHLPLQRSVQYRTYTDIPYADASHHPTYIAAAKQGIHVTKGRTAKAHSGFYGAYTTPHLQLPLVSTFNSASFQTAFFRTPR